jgi:hypothetical protein
MTSFTSHEHVGIQAGVQTIHGNVNYQSVIHRCIMSFLLSLTDDDTVPAQSQTSRPEPNSKVISPNLSLWPVANYVARPRLQQKVKEQLYFVPGDGGARQAYPCDLWTRRIGKVAASSELCKHVPKRIRIDVLD